MLSDLFQNHAVLSIVLGGGGKDKKSSAWRVFGFVLN